MPAQLVCVARAALSVRPGATGTLEFEIPCGRRVVAPKAVTVTTAKVSNTLHVAQPRTRCPIVDASVRSGLRLGMFVRCVLNRAARHELCQMCAAPGARLN